MTTDKHFPLKRTEFYNRSHESSAAYQTLRILQAITTI